jgi:hypothetical protein
MEHQQAQEKDSVLAGIIVLAAMAWLWPFTLTYFACRKLGAVGFLIALVYALSVLH